MSAINDNLSCGRGQFTFACQGLAASTCTASPWAENGLWRYLHGFPQKWNRLWRYLHDFPQKWNGLWRYLHDFPQKWNGLWRYLHDFPGSETGFGGTSMASRRSETGFGGLCMYRPHSRTDGWKTNKVEVVGCLILLRLFSWLPGSIGWGVNGWAKCCTGVRSTEFSSLYRANSFNHYFIFYVKSPVGGRIVGVATENCGIYSLKPALHLHFSKALFYYLEFFF